MKYTMQIELSFLDQYIREHYWLDPDKLTVLATGAAEDFSADPALLDILLQWAIRSTELNDSWDTHFAVSYVYYFQKDLDTAIEYAWQAIERMTEENDILFEFKAYLSKLHRQRFILKLKGLRGSG